MAKRTVTIDDTTKAQEVNQDQTIEKDTPAISLVGTETGGVTATIKENAGVVEIDQNTKVLKATPIISLQGTETGGVTVNLKEDAGVFSADQDLNINKSTPSLVLAGTETGAITVTIKEDSGVFVVDQDIEISKATPGTRLAGTETGAGDLTVRENAGKVEIYDNAGAAVRVADLINRTGLRDSDVVSATVGTGGATGEAFTTILSLGTGKEHLSPIAAVLTIGGTPGTAETITVNLYAVNDAGTRILIGSYSATGATGSTTLGAQDITVNLITNGAAADIEGHRITGIDVGAYSDATATTATASARAIAEET